MNSFRADLHVHTVLSPCGDLKMSPAAIVETAARRGIDILGITDHNSTKHGPLVSKLAREKGIFVLCGAEVTTREEAHCLTFFENFETLAAFQQYLDRHLPDIKNDPKYFGYQVVLDEQEMIVEEEERLLISGLDQGLDQVETEVHRLGGLFIPAHIDRPRYSLTSQLGFVPQDLKADALEVSRFTTPEEMIRQFPWIESYTFIRSSDAHHPDTLGSGITIFDMENRNFGEIRKALHKQDNRSTRIEKPGI
ncbi:MAG: PHP domain-containing protein [Bacteroides sp.]|jgi:PHP family Zn ribbon phosphoesterase|nr:PHP domain-containing protein [Bacteroides sp.]